MQAVARCTQCSRRACRAHARSSSTRAAGLLAEHQGRGVAAPHRTQGRAVLCAGCRTQDVRRTLGTLADHLRADGQARGTAWTLAHGLWSEREDTGDTTYAQLVHEAAGWPQGADPFEEALACFRSLATDETANPMTVTFTYQTQRRQTWLGTRRSEHREETVGQLNGWIVRYEESTNEYPRVGTFVLDPYGEVYTNPGLTDIRPGTARYAIPYGHSYAAAAGTGKKDVAKARSRLTGWLAGVAEGTAERLEAFHCDACAQAAAVQVARIALGLR